MNPVNDYLRLCHDYCDYLGGLRWSSSEDAIEYGQDHALVFAEELAQFLEGFAAEKLLHFAYVVHLFNFIRPLRTEDHPEIARLRNLFHSAGGTLRNAGVFFAHICRELSEDPTPVTGKMVRERLRNRTLPVRWFVGNYSPLLPRPAYPSLGPKAFEAFVIAATLRFSGDEILHWFRHGTGTIGQQGEELARQMPLPRTLGGMLAELLERPRLSAARSLVAQLASALTLPRPKLAPQQLPMGGYTDVSTRGHVDQILPSQFALDELDFHRRFAEHELLYFRREEPHSQTRRELVVVLDQGVRTWGEIRLVLAAAVVAFGKQAVQGKLPFLVAATSNRGKLCNPLDMEEDDFGELVETSDLSTNPGLALEHVLEQGTEIERDVVLLTHRRSLRDEDVIAAAHRVTPLVRLFAMSLDASGEVELSRLQHGQPVAVRRFRVDFSRLQPEEKVPVPAETSTYRPWTGDVEPVGYPFRFGLTGPLLDNLFEFDHAGEWLLTACQDCMLHAWKTDGSKMEILPRGVWDGALLTRPRQIVGVTGGFAVVGFMNGNMVVFHYDLKKRHCTAHELYPHWHGELLSPHCWYLPQFHSLIVDPKHDLTGCALDLSNGERFYFDSAGLDPDETLEIEVNPTGRVQLSTARLRPASRAEQAWRSYEKAEPPTGNLRIHEYSSTNPATTVPPCFIFRKKNGDVIVDDGNHKRWPLLIPVADGQPIFRHVEILEARCREYTLAVKTRHKTDYSSATLHLLRGPEGIPLAEYHLQRPEYGVTLSGNGQYLAFKKGPKEVQIVKVGESTQTVLTTYYVGWSTPSDQEYVGKTTQTMLTTFQGHFHPRQVMLGLGNNGFGLRTGKTHWHSVWWDKDALKLEYNRWGPSARTPPPPMGGHLFLDPHASATASFPSDNKAGIELIECFPERFIEAQTINLTAVLDRFGHVLILDQEQQLVCMFFAFRNQMAVWMPDGTHAGSPALTGSAPTPGALEKIGRALRQAQQQERTVQ